MESATSPPLADRPVTHRTVIVGHDGTPAADAALRLAEQLAGDGARLLLARVVAGAGARPDAAGRGVELP